MRANAARASPSCSPRSSPATRGAGGRRVGSKAELAYGARLAAEPERAAALVDAFCEPFASLPFDDACIEAYARLRAHQRAHGTAIGARDLTIASIALTHGLALVSGDRAAFARVPGLTVVSWRDG